MLGHGYIGSGTPQSRAPLLCLFAGSLELASIGVGSLDPGSPRQGRAGLSKVRVEGDLNAPPSRRASGPHGPLVAFHSVLGRFESTRTSAEARAELDARGRREALRNTARTARVIGGAYVQSIVLRAVTAMAADKVVFAGDDSNDTARGPDEAGSCSDAGLSCL